ncbi:hypothetical protein ABFP60_00040 [Clostridioides difficile]
MKKLINYIIPYYSRLNMRCFFVQFKKYASKKGVLISLFVATKMKEFIEEEKEFEEYKEKKKKGAFIFLFTCLNLVRNLKCKQI